MPAPATQKPYPLPSALTQPPGRFASMKAVNQEASADIDRSLAKGNYGEAAGHFIRGTGALGVAIANDALVRPAASALVPAAKGAADLIYTAATGNSLNDPAAAAAAAPAARPAAAAAAGAMKPGQVPLPAGVTPSSAGAGRGTAITADPVVGRGGMGPASLTQPVLNGQFGQDVEGAEGVKKFVQNGKTLYSNVPGAQSNDSLMNGKGGTVSVIPSAPSAVGALVQPTGSSALDAQLSAARLAAVNRGDVSAVANSYGGNFAGGQGAANPLMDQISSGLQSGKQLTARGAQALVDVQRNGISAQGNALTAQRLAMEAPGMQADTAGKQLTVRNAQQVETARQAYLNAPTPEAKKAAESNLRALTGKFDQENFTTQVMQGQVDALGNRTPAVAVITDKHSGQTRLLDASGQEIGQRSAQQPQVQPMPKTKAEAKVGAIYQTSRGPAKWDGSQFIPVTQ